jgi:signal peptidase I
MHNTDESINLDSLNLERVALELMIEALRKRKYVNLSMGGTSMIPTINDSEVITIEKIIGRPQLGDIIAYRANGSIIAHRVVKIDCRGRYYTKGDNRLGIEGPIEMNNIIGKITKKNKIGVSKSEKRIKDRYIARFSLISGLIYRIIGLNKIFDFKGRFTDALRLILNSPIRFLK